MSSPSPARRLGPYELLTLVGRGGMGEVWQARDPRLNRFVAIKLSREEFNDRFQREARAVAALNHPNICHLYDVGPNYLVMEYVEGTELRGPLSEEEVLKAAGQIADALEAAHEKGIIHRDLKPANIRITADGVVKVLDFGLARMTATEASDPSESPTTLASPTQMGTILGTAAYMAPEQARGKAVDKRADIWAFGVVLCELLTGTRLFAGDTATDVLAEVLKTEPDLGAVPVRFRRLLGKCLEKDPKKRLRDIGDWRLLAGPASEAESLAPPKRPSRIWSYAAVGFALIAAGLAFVHFRERPATLPEPIRFQIQLPDDVQFEPTTTLSFSPDGRHVAFAGVSKGYRVYVQDLDGGPARALVNTRIGTQVPPFFWSPDSRYVVYSENSSKLTKVDITSGTVEAICDKPGPPVGGSWSADGTIIFGSSNAGLWRVPANGGTPAKLTQVSSKEGERSNQLPEFLPDGRHFLYLATFADPSKSGIYEGSLDDAPGAKHRRVVATEVGGHFVAGGAGQNGWLLYLKDKNLMAQAFDPKSATVQGTPALMSANIGIAFQTALFAASRDVLVYRSGDGGNKFQLTWFDPKTEKPTTAVGEPVAITSNVLSPDETRVAYSREDENLHTDIWILDLARGASTRLTSGAANADYPIWSPDGSEVMFSRLIEGAWQIFRRKADGSGSEQFVLKGDDGRSVAPTSWSPDGRYILFDSSKSTGFGGGSIGVLKLEPGAKPFGFTAPGVAWPEDSAVFSPDGAFVSYGSQETGQYQIYVRAFSPDPSVESGAKWLVSNPRASFSEWGKDGKKLYWVVQGGTIWSADIDTSHGFHAGLPVKVYSVAGASGGAAIMTRRGQALLRFPVEHSHTQPINVMVNWRSAAFSGK